MNVCDKEMVIRGRVIRVARLAAEKYEFLKDPEPILDACRRSGSRIDVFTFMEGLSQTTPRFDYAMEWDNFAALPVSTFDTWWTKQLDNKTRNMVRRAEKKGIVVREVPFDDALVEGISKVYDESSQRQGKAFSHFGKDLQTVRSENGTFLERSVFIGAYFESNLIGFAKLVSDEQGVQAGLMQILSMIQHRDKAPTNALIAEAVRACAARGIPYLVYANFAYGNKQRDSLSDFKKNNGFRPIDVPRYYVPLTLLGQAAVGLGLHRPMKDYVPEQLLEQLRRIRGQWHNRLAIGTRQTS